MKENLARFLPLLRKHEGGYADDPRDPGGCTNLGITIATYRRHVDAKGTCAALKEMPWSTAEKIYRDTYWAEVSGDELPHGVDVSVFDMGVNAGPSRAAKLLQHIIGAAADGIVGPQTIGYCDQYKGDLILAYGDARLRYYRTLVGYRHFGRGWERRTEATKVHAYGCPYIGADPMPDERAELAPAAKCRLTITRTNVSRGTQHPDVKLAQGLLIAAGRNPGATDGIAGQRFMSSVKGFQRLRRLTPDGILGPKTWRALENAD